MLPAQLSIPELADKLADHLSACKYDFCGMEYYAYTDDAYVEIDEEKLRKLIYEYLSTGH